MYVKSMKDDYTLYDAFNILGMRLYGPEWTGYEVWRERVEDPSPVIQALAPLQDEADQLATQISAKYNEQKEVEGRSEIQRVNFEIDNLRKRQSEVYLQIHQLDDLGSSQVKDYERWVRFENTEGKILKALCNEEFSVVCLFGMVVKSEFWTEMPEGFSYDFERSLIFWPSNSSSRQMSSGIIRKKQFEEWLETVIPIVPHEGANISIEQRAQSWLKEYVKFWDGKTKRDQIKDLAMSEYPDLAGRAFKRIWDAEASVAMKSPGPRKST